MALVQELLSREEIAGFTRRSDLSGAWVVLSEWLIIGAVFAGVAIWTNPVTILLGVLILGGRQLGLSVIVHECGHRTLFRSDALNDFCGKWLAAYPVMSDKDAYMRGHLQHHRLAGTLDDPDLQNYQDYPISRSRLWRKLKRDITGQTGWKALQGIVKRLRNRARPAAGAAVRRGLLMNALLFLMLLIAGQGWLYLLWVGAFLTSLQLFSRIRQVAEHGAVPDSLSADPRLHTRTTYASLLERLLVAPNQVNYHLEHHLLPSVPMYHLRAMHRCLRDKGAYRDIAFPQGYLGLLRGVTHPG